MSRNETKLLSFKTTNFFDIEKLCNKNPELYAELCEKYPVKHKECVFAIIYRKEEVKSDLIKETQPKPKPLDEPVQQVFEPKVRENLEPTPTIEEVNEAIENDIVNETTDGDEPVVDITIPEEEPPMFPEDFQPLYKIGEVIVISYANGEKTEFITIKDIIFDVTNRKYYYDYLVDETGEIKRMGEEFLVDHEV